MLVVLYLIENMSGETQWFCFTVNLNGLQMQ